MAQRVGRVIALPFHDRDTRRGLVVSSTLRQHFIPGKELVSIVQEAGWAPGPVWTGEKSRLKGIFLKHVLPFQLNKWLTKKNFSSFFLYYMCYVIHNAILCLHFVVSFQRRCGGGLLSPHSLPRPG